jgi:uncharacterized membrane protein YhhN
MLPSLPWLALLLAALNWLAVGKGWRWLEVLAKPGTMLALLAWLGPLTVGNSALFWFDLGLIFSLVGDVLLMLPRERFLGGLVAFLLAHVAYIVGFNLTAPPLNLNAILFAGVIGLAAWDVYRRIRAGVSARLRWPVLVYVGVISLMVLSAWLSLLRPEWGSGPAMLVSVGASLFMISDSLLAWDRFLAPVRYGRVLVMVTYHLGQVGIVVGAALHFHG